MHLSTQTPDALLVASLGGGDERAFDLLYQRYYPKLFYFLRKMCRSTENAEDLAHEAFAKIWANHRALDPGKCFSSYLFTIAKHQLLNDIRRRDLNHSYLKQIRRSAPATEDQTETAVIFSDYVALFEKTIGQLPPHKQRIFLLTHEEGKTHREIADTLHISKKTVEFHLRDCLKALRQQFTLHTDVVIVALLMSYLGC
jgi:RNA polymerase sigma-70 factor (ECF subfamily)